MNTGRQQGIYATPDAYLSAERVSETKHEYLAGVVYAMAGASREHNVISRNLMVALGTQLRGKKCEPFGSDMRLRMARPIPPKPSNISAQVAGSGTGAMLSVAE